MQRRVAIKRMPLPLDAAGRPHRPHGLAEARTAAMLNHPNIVTVFDFDTDSDEAFLVMEHVDGASLAEHARRRRGHPHARRGGGGRDRCRRRARARPRQRRAAPRPQAGEHPAHARGTRQGRGFRRSRPLRRSAVTAPRSAARSATCRSSSSRARPSPSAPTSGRSRSSPTKRSRARTRSRRATSRPRRRPCAPATRPHPARGPPTCRVRSTTCCSRRSAPEAAERYPSVAAFADTLLPLPGRPDRRP